MHTKHRLRKIITVIIFIIIIIISIINLMQVKLKPESAYTWIMLQQFLVRKKKMLRMVIIGNVQKGYR